MAERMEILSEAERPLRMHPKKFAMWLFMVSVVMLFAGLTSAYIVRRAEGNWDVFDLPTIFYWSTAVILASSVTMHWAVSSARANELAKLKQAISLTSVLGVAFLVMQVLGWGDMVDMSVYFTGNPSGSLVYVLSGVHAAHLISGVIFLLIMLVAAFQYKVHSKQLVKIEMCATYWHFLDGLWVYLFLFMLFNR